VCNEHILIVTEELIASIIENQVDSQEVDTYEGEVASLYEEADQITSDTLEAEWVMSICELFSNYWQVTCIFHTSLA